MDKRGAELTGVLNQIKLAILFIFDLNIPLAGTAQTGGWFQPVRSDVPMVPGRNR